MAWPSLVRRRGSASLWIMVGVVVVLCVVGLFWLQRGKAGGTEGSGEAGGGREVDRPAEVENLEAYHIVTTVGMVADVVRAVAGDRAIVENIIGEGIDPHLYKPTRNDVARLLDADIVFYSGLLLEGKMSDALVRVGRMGKPVYAVTELVDESMLLQPDGVDGHSDPHLWMDVEGWMHAVDAVALAMSEIDPDHASEYTSNANTYRIELEALDAYAVAAIASIPETRRILITAHDAFNYFGRAYGIEVIGIQGMSTESEAGLDDINTIVDLLVNRAVPAVFVETSVADKNVRALIEGARASGHEVRIGGSLFSDAMGPPGSYEGTYVGMIDHNVTVIAGALGGDVPPRGLQGMLDVGNGE